MDALLILREGLPAVQTFNDFDAWAEAVSGASLRLACDAVETPSWTLGILDLGGVVLQVASGAVSAVRNLARTIA